MGSEETIPLVLTVLICVGGPVAIVIVAIAMNYLSKKKRYEAMVKAIELGGTKDPEAIKELFLADKPKEKGDGTGYLKGGIVVSGIGLGLFGMGLALSDGGLYGPSVFMFILGLAMILVYLVIKPKDKKK
jgi:hypothetical protein